MAVLGRSRSGPPPWSNPGSAPANKRPNLLLFKEVNGQIFNIYVTRDGFGQNKQILSRKTHRYIILKTS